MKAVVVSFDRLHLGYLGCYGNPSLQTPHFDRLAVQSVVFDQHFAENIAENAANHAWWTGRYQFPLSNEQQHALPCFFDQLSGAPIAMERLVMDEKQFQQASEILVRPRDDTNRSSLLWLETVGPRFDSSQPNRDKAMANYVDQISAYDRSLGVLLAAINGLNDSEQPLLIVTAAAGERMMTAFGSSEEDDPLPEEVVHCPLWIRVPGSEQAGSRRQALTQPTDLAPTLVEWFGITLPNFQLDGQSLIPLLEGRETEIRESAFLGNGQNETAIRDRDFCLIRSGTAVPRLFIKPDDRFNKADVASQYPSVVDDLEQLLNAFLPDK